MSSRQLSVIGLVVAMLLTGAVGEANAGALRRRDQMLHLLNGVRRNHDLPTVRLNRELSADALRHSRRMASKGSVFHTRDLYGLVRSYTPSCWGENVGMAGTMRTVLRLWMRSSGHRANVLRRSFRRVGIGVAKASGSVWITVIFYGG
ncbi:MAG TPA: CAP domain-containing protein [Actinomycetota bacterium]|nr:CAP domain-containing protein [Actinomycetota bacterium]